MEAPMKILLSIFAVLTLLVSNSFAADFELGKTRAYCKSRHDVDNTAYRAMLKNFEVEDSNLHVGFVSFNLKCTKTGEDKDDVTWVTSEPIVDDRLILTRNIIFKRYDYVSEDPSYTRNSTISNFKLRLTDLVGRRGQALLLKGKTLRRELVLRYGHNQGDRDEVRYAKSSGYYVLKYKMYLNQSGDIEADFLDMTRK
jgi:hypothetical protein